MALRFALTLPLLATLVAGIVLTSSAFSQPNPTAGATSQDEPLIVRVVPPPMPPERATSPAGPDEIVCKDIPPQTGSRIGGARECQTAREWAREQAESQSILAREQEIGLEGLIPPPKAEKGAAPRH